MIVTKHVRLTTHGRVCRVSLDRPAAINALTLAMIEEIDFALDFCLRDPRLQTLVLDGAGDRGFCAGGDVVALRASALEDGELARRFWAAEYRLNARIASFPRPVVALMDGVVMGGGVGLAGHASHRIATERLAWAMPEVLIGFAPDVGGTYLLSRLPGEVGTFLALTATQLGCAEAVSLGLADAVVRREAQEELVERLGEEEVDLAVAALRCECDGPGANVPIDRETVDRCFVDDDVERIAERVENHREELGEEAVANFRKASPTSLKAALAALRRARQLPSLQACLAQEYRTSSGFLAVPDFDEGIRAVLVDKDLRPHWAPATLGEVGAEAVERILAGPSGLEPLWHEESNREDEPSTSR